MLGVDLFLVERGADLTIHAAAGLGLSDWLSHMLDADPSLVNLKGGDGCTPLHFARDVRTAKLLLDHCATRLLCRVHKRIFAGNRTIACRSGLPRKKILSV